MEKLSEINRKDEKSLKIQILPYMKDHIFQGRTIFPAVESMHLLSSAVSSLYPGYEPCVLMNAAFEKFLQIDPLVSSIEAFIRVESSDNGRLVAKLLTRQLLPQMGINRVKEHAVACFDPAPFDFREPPHPAAIQDDAEMKICAEDVYRDLVPFGKAYQNIDGWVKLYKTGGAEAKLHAPLHPAETDPLGSPFPLDAAFHAACVWGQRYTGIIGFPVGFEKRTIFHPIHPGVSCSARIIPLGAAGNENLFDLWIHNEAGELLHEHLKGVRMRDISGGKLKPPDWITGSAS